MHFERNKKAVSLTSFIQANFMQKLLFFIRYRYSKIYRLLLVLAAMAVIIYFFPKTARFAYEYKRGYPWTYSNLIAPFNFAVNKTADQLAVDKQEALESLLPYYRFDSHKQDSMLSALEEDFERAWGEPGDSLSTYFKRKKMSKQFVDKCFQHLLHTGIRSQQHTLLQSHKRVMLVKEQKAKEVDINSIYTLQTAQVYVKATLEKASLDVDKEMVNRLLTQHLFQNVHYDISLNEKATEVALSSVSESYGMVQKGELIISKGELVTEDKYQILQSLKKAFDKQLGGMKAYQGMLLGQILVLLAFLATVLVYLLLFKREVAESNRRLSLLLVLILMAIVPQALVIRYAPDYIYAVPLPLLAIVGKSFFDDRTTIFIYSITVLFIASFVPTDVLTYIVLQTITGIVAIVSIFKLNNRAQFYLTSFWIFISYIVLYLALMLIQTGHLSGIDKQMFYMFGISAVGTLIGYPSIYLFERVFSQVTEFTLLELSNVNNKLLRKLAQKAPGTFQHSLQVGNLAGAAITHIGGDALLVRTGALYHDIGKLFNPQFFTENQPTHINPHEELNPEESASIIIDHVVQGVELAKRHGLPGLIIDFIRTHHGTRRPEYFYRMAVEEVGEENVNKEAFQYPGPLPFSKETAVLMMADSIEAASRSIPQPTEENLSALVEKIINSQMADGQFEQADITFKDISDIKKIFIKMLQTIYHVRIEYPD